MTTEAPSIRPIRTDADHEAALRRVGVLMGSIPGTPEFDELDVLATLVEAYERKRYPIRKPTPVEAIQFRMEQMDYSVEDLGEIVGSPEGAAEILSGERPLDLRTIRRLRATWGIPADVLLGDTLLADEAA